MLQTESQTSQPGAGGTNGASTPHELFALTDEQILEIEPEEQDLQVSSPEPKPADAPASVSQPAAPEASASASPGGPFSAPDDVRALGELYPGGLNQAKTAAERARTLDEIDAAYFGAAGNTPEQTTAARAQLAAAMLREDPAAFREMVFAGLRALEEAEKGSGAALSAGNLPRLAQVFAASRDEFNVASRSETGTSAAGSHHQTQADAGLRPGATSFAGTPATAGAPASLVGAQHVAPQLGTTSPSESQLQAHAAAYAAFEKTANEDLERSVGAAIERTISQALPNLERGGEKATAGARNIVPLQDRLSAAVRQDVEAALKGDRQLGEQIAQILSARRFDTETRAQVVRLINDRAQQLVPGAARRVINEWTQATLSAHRAKSGRADAASRPDIEPALGQSVPSQGNAAQHASPAASSEAARSSRDARSRAAASTANRTPSSSRIDYRKLSDEQILDM